VVVYDQRGHGRSTIGDAGLIIEALADDLHAVLEQMDLTDAVVVGHSMGGMAAQALAIAHPATVSERVRALVLVATACSGLGMPGRLSSVAESVVASSAFGRAAAHPVAGRVRRRRAVGRRPALAQLRAVAEMFAATPAATRSGFLAAIAALDLRDGLTAIDVPVTVVCGTHDRLTPLAGARRIGSVPGARLVVLPDAGHMLPCEEPQALARIVLEAAGRDHEAVAALTSSA
jgi:3-oxoadipate enol-lactonase